MVKAIACEVVYETARPLSRQSLGDLAEVEQRLRLYEDLCNQRLRPFQWKFTQEKLIQFLDRLEAR